MIEGSTQVSVMTPERMKRLLAKVPMCEKVGVISDTESDEYYVALFKRASSTKPVAAVPMIHVVMMLEAYFDAWDATGTEKPPEQH